MIFDTLEHAGLYEAVCPGFAEAFRFLEQCRSGQPAPGRYEIDGNRVYALLQEYDTKDAREIPWEAHRRYIDIQCVLRGREKIGYAPLSGFTDMGPYDEEKDCLLAQMTANNVFLPVRDGAFAVFYPHDAHKPRCSEEQVRHVVKAVIKILIEE